MIDLCRIMIFIDTGIYQGMNNTSGQIKTFASVISIPCNFANLRLCRRNG